MKKCNYNPYITGGLTGILMIFSVIITNKFFGSSSALMRMVIGIENIFSSEHVAQNTYFKMFSRPLIDWQFMFVVGIFVGSAIISFLVKSFKKESIPPMWKERFGSSFSKRAIAAFFGSFLVIIGARMSGGCPSGHGLTGVSILSVASFITLICFCIAGVVTAHIIYKGKRSI